MRKSRYFLMTAAAVAFLLSGCKEPNEPEVPQGGVGTFTLTEIVNAAADAYKTWEEKESFAETIKVGSKDLSMPEYQYAICKALINISSGLKDDVAVLSFKPADHPERDSYDKETIAVSNGPKNGEETEDLVNIATRMLSRMTSDLRVPNQTNFTRNGSPIAFSTDRATTVISRALANYKANGKLDTEISAAYKGAGSSIKAFAQEYVKIIDVWQKNVGTLDRLSNWELAEEGDADIVKDAHYVPNDYTFTFAEKTYNTADMLETAVRSYLLLRGFDGKDVDAIGFGAFPTVTPANMNAVIPETHEYSWNKPLIETSNGGYLCKIVDDMETYGQVDVIILDNWAMRSVNFSFNNDMMWTNFCSYPRDPITNYKGIFSSGRALLTYAFFFKYLLDNKIDRDIDKIDASVAIRSELFGIDTANNDKDIQLKETEVEFACTEETKDVSFAAKAAWTATPSADWITVTPASGNSGAATISIKVAANSGAAREGKVIIKGGNVTEGVEILVKQAEYTAPNEATIKDFAQEYVKLLTVWQNTTGTIDQKKGENYEGGSDLVENAHYIPMSTTITVGNKTYNTADIWEIALRSYLLVRGYDGLDTKNYGAGKIAALPDGAKAMSETTIPETHKFQWGAMPYNETGTSNPETGASSGNGGHLFKWVGGKEVHCQVDPLILDNWAMRSLNFTYGNDMCITNLCGYPRDPFNDYYGAFSSMRALITYAFFFKYMLDHNLEKADGLDANVIIRSELFGDEGASAAAAPTIKDFATEFVKVIDIWQANVGEIKMHSTVDATPNAHYIPDDTTIKVGDKVYNTADMYETAARCYLLVRGYDGLDTENFGAGKIAALPGGAKAMSTTEVPATHGYTWGESPYNELGSYDIATGKGESNNGHLIKIVDGKAVHGQVDVTILDNQVMRATNYQHGRGISNMCTYPRDPITNYAGSFSAKRALLTYAFFFKYMLDNNLDKADGIGADVVIRSELFGDES